MVDDCSDGNWSTYDCRDLLVADRSLCLSSTDPESDSEISVRDLLLVVAERSLHFSPTDPEPDSSEHSAEIVPCSSVSLSHCFRGCFRLGNGFGTKGGDVGKRRRSAGIEVIEAISGLGVERNTHQNDHHSHARMWAIHPSESPRHLMECVLELLSLSY